MAGRPWCDGRHPVHCPVAELAQPGPQTVKRVYWYVSPIAGIFGWEVHRLGMPQRKFLFQYRAIEWAASECAYDWEEFGVKSELVIQGRNGKYRERRTYGEDPPKIKG